MKFETMGRRAGKLMVVAMLGMAPVCYADSSGDTASLEAVQKEAGDFMRALKAYSADQRDEAVKKTKAALDELDKRIDALQKHINESWDKMDKAAREHAQASLEALRKQRSEVAAWYDKLKSSSVEAWGHMKKGFSDAYGSLYEAWEKSEKEFGADK